MSGHSKWAQIKHKKASSDAKKGNLFSKLAREIAVAAREGGADPSFNARLRVTIERAKSVGLPKDNIARALAKASGPGSGDAFFEFLYEAKGPLGVSILIEGITDNKNRTLGELRRVLLERGAKIADPGSCVWNFEKIGILAGQADAARGVSKEGLELAIIESGAREYEVSDDEFFIETDFTNLAKTRSDLEKRGFNAREQRHFYKPKTEIVLPPDKLKGMSSLLEELSAHDDVQEVYTNVK